MRSDQCTDFQVNLMKRFESFGTNLGQISQKNCIIDVWCGPNYASAKHGFSQIVKLWMQDDTKDK